MDVQTEEHPVGMRVMGMDVQTEEHPVGMKGDGEWMYKQRSTL